jgi:hypothetical protein
MFLIELCIGFIVMLPAFIVMGFLFLQIIKIFDVLLTGVSGDKPRNDTTLGQKD